MRTWKSPAVLMAALTLVSSVPAVAAEQQLVSRIEEIGPWTHGVPKERQQKAEASFKAGNDLFEEYAYVAAAEQYRQALESWNHPAIHFNLALALMTLDRPLEIREHLAAAISYGPDPLDPVKFEYARTTLDLVGKQLARVTISCEEPGASVAMDGEPLFVGPGRFEGFVRPGPHTVVATKVGYITATLRPALSPGQQSEIPVELKIDQIQYRRKWSVWKPWAVVGTGVALALGGGWLYREARADYRTFDDGILECGGCVPPPGLAETRSRGERLHGLAVGTWAAGGAALAVGTAMVLLNRPEPYRLQPEGSDQTVVITPLLGGGTRGVLATFSF